MLLSPGKEYDYNGKKYNYPDIKLVFWAGGNPFHHQMDLSKLNSWSVLKNHAERVKNTFNQVDSFKKALSVYGIKFDLSNQLIDEDILTDLVKLTNEVNIDGKIEQLISGDKINKSEDQGASHMELRSAALKLSSKKN